MALEKVDGVEDVDVSYEAGSAIVTFDPEVTSPAEFIGELTRLTGFTAEVMEMTEGDSASASGGSH